MTTHEGSATAQSESEAAAQGRRGAELTLPEVAPRRVVAELVVVLAGLGLFAGAWALSVEWLTRRFGLEHPYFLTVERAILVTLGLVLVVAVRPWAGRWTQRVGAAAALGACFRIGLALVLAVVASEVALRVLHLPNP